MEMLDSPRTPERPAAKIFELKQRLIDRNSKLADVALDFHSSDLSSASISRERISLEHLKCSIVISACARASKFNDAARNGELTADFDTIGGSTVGVGSGGRGADGTKRTSNIELPSESFIKELLVNVCDACERDESSEAILWLCVHIQRAPFLRMSEHKDYILSFASGVDALANASTNHGYQDILDRVLKTTSDILVNELPADLKSAFVRFLDLEELSDWTRHMTSLKIRAININSYRLSSSIYGWSSSDAIYFNSDHTLLRDVLTTLSLTRESRAPEATTVMYEIDIAESILEVLALHEGTHCVARKLALENDEDPTLFSTPTKTKDISLTVSCDLVRKCVQETGRFAESVLLGGFLNLDELWSGKVLHKQLKKPIIPLHGLCPACLKDKAVTGLPLLDPETLPEMAFCCSGKVIPWY